MALKLWQWFSQSMNRCDHQHTTEEDGIISWGSVRNILSSIHVYRPDIVNAADIVNTGQLGLYSKIFMVMETACGVPLLFSDMEFHSDESPKNDLLFLTYIVYLYSVFKDFPKNCMMKDAHDTPLSLALRMPHIRPFVENAHPSLCVVCEQEVYILERFVVDRQLRHRKCFSCIRCRQLLFIGLYKKAEDQDDDSKCQNYECLEHEKDTFLAKISMPVGEKLTEKIMPTEKIDLESNIISDPKSFVVLDAEVSEGHQMVEKLNHDPITEEQSDRALLDRITEAVDDVELISSRKEDSDLADQNIAHKPKAPPRIKKKILSAMQSPRTSSPLLGLTAKTNELCSSQTAFYPEDLNPFDDKNDIETPELTSTSKSRTCLSLSRVSLNVNSTNPFLSDDDDDEVKSVNSSVSSSWNVCDEQSESRDTMDLSLKITDSESSRPSSAATNVGDYSKAIGHRSSGYSSMSSATKKYAAPKPPAVTTAPIDAFKKIPEIKAKKRLAPPPPLPVRREIIRDSMLKPEEILDELIDVSSQMNDVELKGRSLERQLNNKTMANEEFVDEWILLCEEKMRLIRKQNDLAFLLRERQLNELHTEVEYQLRCLIEKPEKLKKAGDEQREAYLLQKLLNVIEEKSRLAESCLAEDTLNSRKVDVNDTSDIFSSGSSSKSKDGKKHATTKKLIKSRLKTLKKKILPKKS